VVVVVCGRDEFAGDRVGLRGVSEGQSAFRFCVEDTGLSSGLV
jgi:hypothetical protein